MSKEERRNELNDSNGSVWCSFGVTSMMPERNVCGDIAVWRNPRTRNGWCAKHTPTFNGKMSPKDMIPTEYAILLQN